jgi:hypothetical protein
MLFKNVRQPRDAIQFAIRTRRAEDIAVAVDGVAVVRRPPRQGKIPQPGGVRRAEAR